MFLCDIWAAARLMEPVKCFLHASLLISSRQATWTSDLKVASLPLPHSHSCWICFLFVVKPLLSDGFSWRERPPSLVALSSVSYSLEHNSWPLPRVGCSQYTLCVLWTQWALLCLQILLQRGIPGLLTFPRGRPATIVKWRTYAPARSAHPLVTHSPPQGATVAKCTTPPQSKAQLWSQTGLVVHLALWH